MSLPPVGTVICSWVELQQTGTVLYRTDSFDGFVILDDYLPRGYVDACPHNGMMLGGDQEEADYMTREQDVIICRWHGASFLKEDGLCIGGPCAGQHLAPWAVERRGDEVVTV
ncbi:MAG: Rieske 2Fe-2S domain-containing protein [Asticcacaulis sp.]